MSHRGAHYEPQPGTIPARVVALLAQHPPGTELPTAVIAEAIGQDPDTFKLQAYCAPAVRMGLLVPRKPPGQRWCVWRLGTPEDRAEAAQAYQAAQQRAQAEDAELDADPALAVPRFVQRRRPPQRPAAGQPTATAPTPARPAGLREKAARSGSTNITTTTATAATATFSVRVAIDHSVTLLKDAQRMALSADEARLVALLLHPLASTGQTAHR